MIINRIHHFKTRKINVNKNKNNYYILHFYCIMDFNLHNNFTRDKYRSTYKIREQVIRFNELETIISNFVYNS